MREDLKGRNLTFTEIAKLVGENWQSLAPAEKEPFETQAQTAKDKYNADFAEYKKTPEYKRYMVYLQEFKAKHSHQSQGMFLIMSCSCSYSVSSFGIHPGSAALFCASFVWRFSTLVSI
jgi:hypothetical protein